jgi:hypothetical protein
MDAKALPDGDIRVRGVSRDELFTVINAGVGWSAEQPAAIVVIGLRRDGRFHALEEATGSLFEITDSAVEIADRLLVDTFLIDATDRVAADYFRRTALKGRHVVRSVPVRIISHFRSALEHARGLLLNESALINERLCPTLLYSLRQNHDYAMRAPVVRALVYALLGFQDWNTINDVAPGSTDSGWYRNRRRR